MVNIHFEVHEAIFGLLNTPWFSWNWIELTIYSYFKKVQNFLDSIGDTLIEFAMSTLFKFGDIR